MKNKNKAREFRDNKRGDKNRIREGKYVEGIKDMRIKGYCRERDYVKGIKENEYEKGIREKGFIKR